jgi:hypothetical protein
MLVLLLLLSWSLLLPMLLREAVLSSVSSPRGRTF